MNAREKKFVAAYTGNQTDAARKAGYTGSDEHLANTGSKLMRNSEVKKAIEAKVKLQVEELELDGAKVLKELANLGFSDITEIFNDETCSECGAARGTLKHPSGMRPEVRKAIRSIEFEEAFDGASGEKFVFGRVVKISFWDKPKSLELLGKNKGLFPTKVEHSVEKRTLEQLITGSFEEDDGE